ncbi:YtxH domain-containing protein [Bacteroides sp.]
MGNGSAKFLLGLGIGSAIGALFYHFSHTSKAKKLKSDVFNALQELEVDAEAALLSAKEKAVHTGSKVAGKVADKATEVKSKLDGM